MAAKNIVSTRTIAPTSRRSRRTSANTASYFLPFPFPPRVSGTKIPGGGGGGAGGGVFGAAISVQCTAEFERPEDGFDDHSKSGCRKTDEQPIDQALVGRVHVVDPIGKRTVSFRQIFVLRDEVLPYFRSSQGEFEV